MNGAHVTNAFETDASNVDGEASDVDYNSQLRSGSKDQKEPEKIAFDVCWGLEEPRLGIAPSGQAEVDSLCT